MDLDSVSPLDRLARSRMSTVSVMGDSSILAEMPPPFELVRRKTPDQVRNPAPASEQAGQRHPFANSLLSPSPSRSTTLTSEHFDVPSHINDSTHTLEAEDFDWSEKSTSEVSLLSWLQTQPPDLPVTPQTRHVASRSWDVSNRQSLNSPVPSRHHKSSSMWGCTDTMPTPPVDDAQSVAISRGAYFIESGDYDAGVNCWRIAKDGGNIYGQLLYFLAVDAGWTFDAAHQNLGWLMTKVDPNILRNILATDCPHIADALYRYSTRHPSDTTLALNLAAAINRAGRPYLR